MARKTAKERPLRFANVLFLTLAAVVTVSGAHVDFATYWGGSESETSLHVLGTSDGGIVMAGDTTSADFPGQLPDSFGLNRPIDLVRSSIFVTRFTS